jgi:hypothetical protein
LDRRWISIVHIDRDLSPNWSVNNTLNLGNGLRNLSLPDLTTNFPLFFFFLIDQDRRISDCGLGACPDYCFSSKSNWT